MFKTLPNIRMAVLVGIGGGIPYPNVSKDPLDDIHLGDVVVGWPGDGKPACVYHNRGRSKADWQFEVVGTMQDPDWRLTSALGILPSNYELGQTTFRDQLARLQGYKKFAHPGLEHDGFFRAAYRHIGEYGSNCVACDGNELVQRPPRPRMTRISWSFIEGESPLATRSSRTASYGIRSAQNVTGRVVSRWRQRPSTYLVIRGISDYADSHKNDVWKSHAAGNAAAFTRELLCRIQPEVVKNMEGTIEG